MFDISTYRQKTVNNNGAISYFVSFTDGQSVEHEVEIDRETFEALDDCRRHEKRQKNFHDRHIEHSDLTDETLLRRACEAPHATDEIIGRSETVRALRAAINELPEIQRRRLLLYYETELTYAQIAEIEGCTKMPVKRSIHRAEERIRETLTGRGYF